MIQRRFRNSLSQSLMSMTEYDHYDLTASQIASRQKERYPITTAGVLLGCETSIGTIQRPLIVGTFASAAPPSPPKIERPFPYAVPPSPRADVYSAALLSLNQLPPKPPMPRRVPGLLFTATPHTWSRSGSLRNRPRHDAMHNAIRRALTQLYFWPDKRLQRVNKLGECRCKILRIRSLGVPHEMNLAS